jgi:putative heme-binding domain-containing protein
MVFGDSSNWPRRFGDALFMADWQFGRILLVDLVPRGATYEANAELFLEGGPLNVCDLAFGPDGALYFITGGRGSQSGLYRVTWTGADDLQSPRLAPPLVDPDSVAGGKKARELRKRLEHYHSQKDPSAIDFIRQQLGSDDPWLRFSARIALENQPVSGWRDDVSAAADSRANRTALLALARVGEPADQRIIVDALATLNWSSLTAEELLVPLRTLQLTIIRQGRLDATRRRPIAERLDPLFPNPSFAVNWLLQELLVEFETPGVIERSLDLVENAATQEEQIQYAKTLSRVSTGWDLDSARRVLDWLYKTRSLPGGKLVETTWRNLRSDFEAALPESLRGELGDEWARLDEPRPEEPRTIVPPRPVVQKWTMEDLIDDVNRLRIEDHSADSGQKALAAAACLQCHRVGQRGGHNGPDLTQVGKRFDGRALLESMLHPSRQVDPKYLNATYLMADGRIVTGRTVGVGKDELTIEIDAMTGRSVAIRRDEIEQSMPNPVSPMPEGLLDTLTREEVLDLIALLRR